MTTLTLSGLVGDCWAAPNGDFKSGTNTLFLGHDTGTGNTYRTSVWIPFTVNLPQGKQIISATIKLVAATTRGDYISLRAGCEDADNPSTPVDVGDIVGRVMTSAYADWSFSGSTAGQEYTKDITTAVQEVLDRAGWAAGNTLAVLIKNVVSDSTDNRIVMASQENATYTEPILVIVYNSFVPQAPGVM